MGSEYDVLLDEPAVKSAPSPYDALLDGAPSQKRESFSGYPVIPTSEVHPEITKYLKAHPEVAGMAWGGGENDSDPSEPRSIIVNDSNQYMSDPVKRQGLLKVEAARHRMSETGYTPKFDITPEQQDWRKGLGAYATNDTAVKQSIISRLIVGDSVPGVTPSQQKEADDFLASMDTPKAAPSPYDALLTDSPASPGSPNAASADVAQATGSGNNASVPGSSGISAEQIAEFVAAGESSPSSSSSDLREFIKSAAPVPEGIGAQMSPGLKGEDMRDQLSPSMVKRVDEAAARNYEPKPILEAAMTPAFEVLPRMTTKEVAESSGLDPSGLPARAASIAQTVGADTANFFTSPLGVATLGLGAAPKAIQKLVGSLFAGHVVKESPETLRAITEAKTPEERDQAIAGAVESLMVLGATGLHMAGRPSGAPARAELMAKETLKAASTEALESAAADPNFRKSSPYDPALIDAELAARNAQALAEAGSPLTAAATLRTTAYETQSRTEERPPATEEPAAQLPATDANRQVPGAAETRPDLSAAEAAARVEETRTASEPGTTGQPLAEAPLQGKAERPSVALAEGRPATEPLPDQIAKPAGEAASTPQPRVTEGTNTSAAQSLAGEAPQYVSSKDWRQSALPEQYRMEPELEAALSGSKSEVPSGAGMQRSARGEGGAAGGTGGGSAIVKPKGATPKGDPNFIRVETAPKRLFKGLLTDGAADVLAKSENQTGKLLAKQIRKHVDIEQEINGQLTAEFDRATKGMSSGRVEKAVAELEPYLAAKENRKPLPPISADAKALLNAWENVAEQTGLLSEAHKVQVFDPVQGQYRDMYRMGRAYVPRVFRPEVQRVLSDPQRNPKLFNDLAAELAAHRGVAIEEAAAELRGVSSRFQSSDFMGNMEMARTGQLPEIFYDYNIGNIASKFVPSFSERMAQIIAYGQRLGPRERPLRENLWDVAMKEAEDSYTQQWIRSAEDQSANLRAPGGPAKVAQQAQTLASGLLLSSPTTSVIRNMLSGTAATTEVLGIRRSLGALAKAATSAQAKLDAREIGVVRENLGDFLHADQLGTSKVDDLIRGITNTTLKVSGYNASESFVRTHAAITASQFAKDGIAAIAKDPSSGAAKEALGLFKRTGTDAAKIVAENADWKTGAETRKFIRTIIRETQGGYRFDQTPLWANTATGRWMYQFGRYGTQRARNIWNNAIKPLIGEDVEWNGKTMTRRDAAPAIKMAASAAVLGEAFALIAGTLFGRDRKDASVQEIAQALDDDQKKALALAGERVINDIIMSGTLGVWGQPVDFMKSLKDQSRFKNPAEPPSMASTKALVTLMQNALDQDGKVTTKDALNFAGQLAPGAKQLSDVARNVFDEPLYEAENDVRTLRSSAARWADSQNMDVPKRSGGEYRKAKNSPAYEGIYEALLVGDSDRAKFLAEKFVNEGGAKSRQAVTASVKSRQPFRVGPFSNAEHKSNFMAWAKNNLPSGDYQQAKRVQDRYEAAAKAAGLW